MTSTTSAEPTTSTHPDLPHPDLPHPDPTAPDPTAPALVAAGIGTRATATLLVAFSDDPMVRWFWPDPASYVACFTRLLGLLGIDGGGPQIVDLERDAVGAALWDPPGHEQDTDELGSFLVGSIPESRHPEVLELFEAMHTHHVDGSHWYLPFVGVDPRHQGAGHGSALLRRGLARADDDRLPAYLEASSPGNRKLYERHGFEVLTEVQIADSPPMWPMLRQAAG